MPGLLRGVARTAVVAGTATAVSNRVSRRQANRWADQGQAQPAYMAPEYGNAPPAAPAPAPGPDNSDMLAQLEQLGQLRSSGVLTEAEFEVQKERILAR